ncbi:MAG: ABC transporter permease [Clostridium sp.]|nr:ABC transporter permease [Clostridium sp.]MCM1399771.1 ABC transporter permease [Clostridium sp.]MCM1459602.1 ABC transporter permease [Bacteroides sp.]
MFFKQVWRNAAKNREGNGLFFGSLVIAIVAFYTLLSLSKQDVMLYLAKVESDAVKKLLNLLPVVYVVSLFFVYFLVYFACKYQTDSRRREFGMYLMLGMKRSRMFLMLFFETLFSSLISLLIGIPVALFLTEGVSLATAKVAGLGIIGHKFSFSFGAVIWTVCGYVLVQMLAMLMICIRLAKTQPADFLNDGAQEQQISISVVQSGEWFVIGVILLVAAYYLGIFRMQSYSIAVLFAIFVFGTVGTFSLYKGLGGFLGRRIRRKAPDAVGLETFTARQVQENVLSQHKSLAVASLLLLLALACVSYGISMGLGRSTSGRSADFTLFGDGQQIESILAKEDISEMVKTAYPVYLSMKSDEYWEGEAKAYDLSKFAAAVAKVEEPGDLVENIVENLSTSFDYIIAESTYNQLLNSMGKEELKLNGNQVAVYSSMATDGDFGLVLEEALQNHASIGINGNEYEVASTLYYDNIVADRSITLYLALIVPDELYWEMAREQEIYGYNVRLKDEVVDEMGLMQAVSQMDERIAQTGIEYDSFLSGIGRNLFYTVSASYLTIYLGILFLIIANTVIGLKYLIQQRQTKHRYRTLIMLGAGMEEMELSVKKQIQTFFMLVLTVAVVSSVAAIYTMFNSFTKLPIGTDMYKVVILAAIILGAFVLTELIYIAVVKRTAGREIRSLE